MFQREWAPCSTEDFQETAVGFSSANISSIHARFTVNSEPTDHGLLDRGRIADPRHSPLSQVFVRLLDVRFKPSDSTVKRWHPNHIAYVLEGGSIEITPQEGKTMKIPIKAGEAVWMDSGHHHATNTGDNDIHARVTELKGNTKKLAK